METLTNSEQPKVAFLGGGNMAAALISGLLAQGWPAEHFRVADKDVGRRHFLAAELGVKYADLVYNGLWYTPLRTALDAFIASSQRFVQGEVRMRLFKGSATVVGRRSDIALYDHDLATYDEADRFDHTQSEGFVKLWGLPTKVWSRRQGHVRG